MPAATEALFRVKGLDGLAHGMLWLAAATSGLAMIEPSPHDAILVALIVGSIFVGLRIPRGIAPMAILMAVFVAFDALGSAQATRVEAAMSHSLITAYLGVACVFFACISAWRPQSTVRVLMSGMVVAALIATIAGVIGFLAIDAAATELFTLFGRARGTFKDPNVFAPFLILPLLYSMTAVLAGRSGFGGWRFAVIGLLLSGLLLSFSRGGWLHFAVSAPVFIVLMLGCVKDPAVRIRTLTLGAVCVAGAAAGLVWVLFMADIGGIFAERAVLTQSYDFGALGRFAGQAKAVSLIIAKPFGIGSTEFLRYHPEQPHNVYLNAFLNAGWIGGVAYLTLVILTLWRGLGTVLRAEPTQMMAVSLVATFVGVTVEGLIVDTDHWRSFFLVMGLIWGLSATRRPTAEAPRAGGTSP